MNDSSTFLVILYAILWFVIFFFNLRKRKGIWGVSTIVIASYFFYAVIACLLYFHQYQSYNNKPITVFPFLYLIGMLLIGMTPLLRYDIHNYVRISSPSSTVFNAFLYFYIFIVLVRIPGIISTLPDGLKMLVLEDAGVDLYNETKDAYVASDRQVTNLVAVLYGFFSDVGIFLLFYYLTMKKRKKWISVVLGISVIVIILDSLAKGQRTGPTMVALTCIMTYFLMKPYMELKIRKLTAKLAITGLVLVGVPFLFLTNSRFGSDSSGDALASVEAYVGMAPINFNQYCLDAGGIRNGDRTSPEFKRLLGFSNVPKDVNERRSRYSLKIDDDVFYTYVGDFTLDYGPFWAVIIFIVFSVLFVKIIKTNSNETIPFYKMIPVYFVACVCMQGGMYLFSYSHMANYKIMTIFLVYLLFRFDHLFNRQSKTNKNSVPTTN